MKTKSIFVIICLVVFVSCTSKYDTLTSEIKEFEEKIRNQPIPDKVDGGKLINLYVQFADEFPDDSLAPVVLFNASRLSFALNDFNQSLSLLERLVKNYEDSKPIPDAYVFAGYIYETVKGDFVSAKYWYELFLKDFPNHEMYEDVRTSLNNLGKSPEELVAEFMKNIEEEKNSEHNKN